MEKITQKISPEQISHTENLTPPPITPPRSPKPLFAVISIFLLLATTATFYLIHQSQPPTPSNSLPETYPTPHETSQQEILDSSTDNWQMYQSKTYNFSFKYQPQWRLGEWDQFNQSVVTFDSKIISLHLLKNLLIPPVKATPEYDNYSPLPRHLTTSPHALWLQDPLLDLEKPFLEEKYNHFPTYYQSASYNGAPQGIFINVWTLSGIDTLNQLRHQYSENSLSETLEFVKVGLYDALIIPSSTVYPPEEADLYPIYIWGQEATILHHNDYFYSIFYAGNQYQNSYHQILSTFKFTE